MITLKSHAYGKKPETTIEGECERLRDRMSWEQVHLVAAHNQYHCVMCGSSVGPNRPWMDKIHHWQDHPMRCR